MLMESTGWVLKDLVGDLSVILPEETLAGAGLLEESRAVWGLRFFLAIGFASLAGFIVELSQVFFCFLHRSRVA